MDRRQGFERTDEDRLVLQAFSAGMRPERRQTPCNGLCRLCPNRERETPACEPGPV
jgi:hypothetical protein